MVEGDSKNDSAKKALAAAKVAKPGSKHYAPYLVVYVRVADAVVRLQKSDAGRTLSERVVWREKYPKG